MISKCKTRHIVMVVLLLIYLADFPADNLHADENSKYLDAVREFADKVLEHGKDTYGKPTPLFVDGLNVNTLEPVKWIAPNGDRWVLSNLASQQNLFRTLDGLTTITGDPKYKQAAMDAIKYAFENLRSPNGLLQWGGHQAYDAAADKPRGRRIHEFKSHYPYYELMWEVDPRATKQFIEALWSNHIMNWSNLDMNREAYEMNELPENPWEHEYKGGPVFSQSSGVSMISTGSDLFYAGGVLFKLSGEKEPFVWSKRLANRYAETRNPLTGISAYSYDTGSYSLIECQLGEDFDDRSGPEFSFFPGHQGISSVTRLCANGYLVVTPGVSFNTLIAPRICELLLGEMLGEEGKDFAQLALEELTAWGKVSYRKSDNSWIPMFTDGTSLEGHIFTKGGYYGPKGTVIEPIPAIPMDFWGYALAYRVTGDSFMWEMARDIARGHKLGDIGVTPDVEPQLNMDTDCWQPYTLLGFLELREKSRNDAFLQMAERIGHNLIDNRFHNGYFVPSGKHTYTKFDSPEPLALLQLYATANEDGPLLIPQVWSNRSFFASPYRLKIRGVDNDIIYGLIDSTEPPLSIREAAAKGDVALVKHLVEEGTYIDVRGDGFLRTSLHHAALGGYKEIAELLLVKGADVDARDSYACSALHYAAEKGHKEIAELLITKGSDVNAKNMSGDTPLHYAAYNDRKDIIELLLEKGATISNIHLAAYMGDLAKLEDFIQEGVDINALDSHGYAPLHYAAQNGQKETVELLIAKGADVNVKNWRGETLFYIAVSRGHKDIIELLMSKGANINTADNKGNALIHHATQTGRKDIVELLIANGAGINTKNNQGQVPLDIAITNNRKDIIDLLVEKGAVPSSIHVVAREGVLAGVKALLRKGVDVNAQDDKGITPLNYAVQGGHKELAELLIANGADINGKDKGGQTPLYYAVDGGNRDMAELLIVKGTDVNAKSDDGQLALHIAIQRNRTEIVKLLIENGADINAKNNEGQTPVDVAVSRNRKEVVELLIAKGADVSLHVAARFGALAKVKSLIEEVADINAKDGSGQTALHYAAEIGHKDIAELLIAKGADVNVKNKDGNTPGHVALRENHSAVLDLLIAKGASLTSIHLSAYQGDLDKVRSFIERGTDVNAVDSYGATPLHYAVVRGNKEVVEFLFARGVHVNAQDENDATAVHFAAGEGHKDIVQIFIANGADVNAKDQWGYTPLRYVVDQEAVAELLIAKGADVNVKDIWGATSLHSAARDGHEAVVRLLLTNGADVHAKNKWNRTPLDLATDRGHTEIVELLKKHGAKE